MQYVIEQLKVIQSSAFVMSAKVHNFHWNVKGIQFFAVHGMTEKIYEEFSELFDDSAERVLQLGQKPYVLLADLGNNSFVIEEHDTDFEPTYVLQNLLSDYEKFLEEFRKLSKLAGEVEDNTTVAFADEKVAKLEKDIWMLKASLA